MPRATVQVADTKSQSRRSFLAAGSAVTVLGAVSCTAAAAKPAVSSELLGLIEMHRRAKEKTIAAYEALDEAERKFNALCEEVRDKEYYLGGWKKECVDFASPKKTLDWLDSMSRFQLREDFPKLKECSSPSMRERIESIERDLLSDRRQTFEAVRAKMEERRIDSRLDEAQRAADDAYEAANKALQALCAFRCASPAELCLKAEYLRDCTPGLYDEHLKALLDSLAGAQMAKG